MKWGEMRIATTGAGRGNGCKYFRAALRRTPPILTAATGSGPPSCQPIPGHCRGRQSGHFLEIASLHSAAGSASAISPLHPPPAALGSLPTGAERPRDDRYFGKGCGEAGRPGGRPLPVHGWKVRCTGDYGLPSQCAHWLGNDREVGKMTWGVRGGEMGWRCELPRPGRVVAMIMRAFGGFLHRVRQGGNRGGGQSKINQQGWWRPRWWR